MSDKSPAEKVQEMFNGMLSEINDRFHQASSHVDGLGQWMSGNLKRLETELKTQMINGKVLDLAVSALVQLLEEKGVLEKGAFKERANKLSKDAQIEVVNTKPDSIKK